MKKAFTLVELVVVIVILSIISVIGADIYTNIYSNYVSSRAITSLETKTELLLGQITSRLDQRVPGAIIGRVGVSADIVAIDDPALTANHNVLEWIGQSTESRILSGPNFSDTIGWSGYTDIIASGLNPATGTENFVSLGSNFGRVFAAINNIGGDASSVAIIFQGVERNGLTRANGFGFNIGYGVADDANNILEASLGAGDTTTINLANLTLPVGIFEISDRYYLAHTAYAIVPTAPDANGLFDLILYKNYKPWRGETYSNGNGYLMAKNVSMFRFRGQNNVIDLKICMKDNNGLGANEFTVCKSKVVY